MPEIARLLACRCALAIAIAATGRLSAQSPPLDPAAWGSDHVVQSVPQFTSGDECLFCHRLDIGPAWGRNRHGQSMRVAEAGHPALAALAKEQAAEVELLLGGSRRVRLLKRAAVQGSLELLVEKPQPHWDARKFGDSCAGCHTTGVDSQRRVFTAHSLDCFVCHGEPPEKHTTQGALATLSPHRRDSPAVVTSICAQCHLRTGKSRSTGLPYANNFVPGDNLFRDFAVDLSGAALAKLNPADRHVQENVRDVVIGGQESVTCLSCHNIHQPSARQHHRVAEGRICLNCHQAGSKRDRVAYQVHSSLCEY